MIPARPDSEVAPARWRRPSGWLQAFGRRRLVTVAVFAFLALAVLAFTGGWRHGTIISDGPGVSLWLRIILKHWRAGDGIPAWIPDLWSGTPIWDLVGSFHLVVLLPLAALFSPDEAVKLGILAAGVVAAWGAFVLARALWGRTWPAVTAGLLYGLHPLFASHGALFGHEPSLWVFAATPWLILSLGRALRREGPQYIAIAGLLIGTAVLEQAEHTYSLMMLCGILLVVELARARKAAPGPLRPKGVMIRAGAVVFIGLGVTAHWLFAFVARSKSFILTPAADVRNGLEFFAGALGRRPQAFMSRATPLSGTIDFQNVAQQALRMDKAAASAFYLSVVCVALTAVTVVWLARRDDDADGTLSAILVVAAMGVWMSMGTVSLAAGGLASATRAPVMVVLGLVVGLMCGNFLRRLDLGRAGTIAAWCLAVFLFVLPFVTPITAAQRLIPFLTEIRFPRLYPLAALAVALAGAFPLTLVERWAMARPRRLPALGPILAVVVMIAFLIDIAPYRSLYTLRPPDDTQAFQAAAATLNSVQNSYRIATPYFGDPGTDEALLKARADLSVGWPHPLAAPDVWGLTSEVLEASPAGYRDAALGLSATAYISAQLLTGVNQPDEKVSDLQLEPNPRVLPMVRAYDQVAVVDDRTVSPELAVALAGRNVGVVTGGASTARALSALGPSTIAPADACDPLATPQRGTDRLGNELAIACSMSPWVGVRSGRTLIPVVQPTGAVFPSRVGGLEGVAVWLDGGATAATELALHEVGADGVSLGPEILRVKPSGIDENGMTRFAFDPIADSAGRTYAFTMTCDGCATKDAPQMWTTSDARGAGNLILGDRLHPQVAAAFSPLYPRMAAADPSGTQLVATPTAPGRWSIQTNGSRASLIVVAESDFPGWVATVDGKSAPVVTADGGFLGVPVGPGQHLVKLEFHRTTAATVGRVVTGITLLICLFLLCPPLRRRVARLTGRSRRRSPASAGRPGDALDVGAPPAGRRRKQPLDARQRVPGTAAAGGQPPGRERDEAVLATVDHVEPGSGDQPEQRRPGEA
jgi:hypothetical protein